MIKESKKYNYNVLSNPYYKINQTYFRIEEKISKLLKNYYDCQEDKTICNQDDRYIVAKKFGKYIFIRKND